MAFNYLETFWRFNLLRSRVAPCLLLHNKGLVKTVNFKKPKYVGDPLNAVKIFNEKEVDELIFIDIDATVDNSEPNYDLIKKIANESRMPICYAGGIKTCEQARRIIDLGVEKIGISSIYFENPPIIKQIADVIGLQSVVVIIDVKKNFLGKYEIFIENGKKKVNKDFFKTLSEIEAFGAGEIVINSIDNDGKMTGYDLKLMDKVRSKVSMPITALGGAGSQSDIVKLINEFKIIGAAAGSLFVFKGIYKAVLINYLDDETKNLIRKINV